MSSTETTPDPFIIGQGQYDDLPAFWSSQISADDRRKILGISISEIHKEMVLNGCTGTLNKARISEILKVFVNSLEEKGGVIDENCFAGVADPTQQTTDEAGAWIIITLLEKRLIEYRQISSIWVQIFWSLIFCLWLKPMPGDHQTGAAWYTVIRMAVAAIILLFLFFSSVHALIPIRRWIYYNLISFFDYQLIPISVSPLLLFGPCILLALNRQSGWECSLLPLACSVQAIACALLTRIVSIPSQLRILYRASILSILGFNIVLVVYVSLAISWWYGLVVGLIFNWSITTALGGMIVLGLVVVGAFMRDVIIGLRSKPLIQKCMQSFLPIFFGSTLWFRTETWKMIPLVCMTSLVALIAIPSPSERIRELISRIGLLALDVIQFILMSIQTLTATCIIFSSSPRLGVEWIKYLGTRMSQPADIGEE
jgi:hypothetical protein